MMELSGQRLIVKHDEGGGILASSPGQFCLYVQCTPLLKKLNWAKIEHSWKIISLSKT